MDKLRKSERKRAARARAAEECRVIGLALTRIETLDSNVPPRYDLGREPRAADR